MAATQVLASGSGAAQSADIVVTTTAVTLVLWDTAGPKVDEMAAAFVEIKASNGQYIRYGMLSASKPFYVLKYPGTYRVVRYAGAAIFGVDQN